MYLNLFKGLLLFTYSTDGRLAQTQHWFALDRTTKFIIITALHIGKLSNPHLATSKAGIYLWSYIFLSIPFHRHIQRKAFEKERVSVSKECEIKVKIIKMTILGAYTGEPWAVASSDASPDRSPSGPSLSPGHSPSAVIDKIVFFNNQANACARYHTFHCRLGHLTRLCCGSACSVCGLSSVGWVPTGWSLLRALSLLSSRSNLYLE